MEKKMKISGVYSITNNVTGELYIGSSKNIKQRWARHKSPSAWRCNPGMKLYQAFIKYGLNNFIFEIIEETDNLKEREQYWIEHFKPVYNDRHSYGYNIERSKETSKRYHKEWYKVNRDEKLTYSKAYNQAHRDERLAKNKAYYSRLCLYEGETLTLSALTNRFFRQGVTNPTIEAKRYLIEGEN